VKPRAPTGWRDARPERAGTDLVLTFRSQELAAPEAAEADAFFE
jgi:hypothetical protein